MNNKQNNKITSRDVDFAKWYTDIVSAAHLAAYSNTKGCTVFEPNGYAIWEQMQKILDEKFKETGHVNVYMPLLIPENLLKKEGELVEGFAPEVAWVTRGGSKELEERLCIRPTSETLFSDYYRTVVSSYRDLPKLYNQWCSVVRWEKTTRPFLRGSEFLWQEGHTIHASEEEARKETLQMLEIYRSTAQDLLAIPMVTGRKTESEKFAGAEETYTIEALMHDGKALQSGTSHYFGQGFAKAFDVKFLNKDNKQEYVYQTSWGVSTRLLGAIIMVHGDDNGLVLPPRVAPIQVMIVPVMQHKEGVLDKAYEIEKQLKAAGLRVKVDASDKTPGYKFADAEMRGIPLRLEIGPKDIEKGQCVLAKRLDGTKETYALNEELPNTIHQLLDQIHDEMYAKALKFRDENIRTAKTYDEFKEILNTKAGYIRMMWCEDEACESQIKEETGATSRCIKEDEEAFGDVCPICGKPAKKVVYFAKAY